ncbi:MAG: YncE family protein, partial [Lacunisphaera sp.]
GKPEFLAADGKGNVYVNLEDKDKVAVVNVKAGKVVAYWPTAPGGAPVGMAIDAKHRRLFIGCRNPQKLLIMDCDNGKVLADLPIGRGVDAVAFDDGYALASCGDGTLTVVGESAPGQFRVVGNIFTAQGARTAGLDPNTHTLYLPTAEMEPSTGKGRPRPKPDSFMVIKVLRPN